MPKPLTIVYWNNDKERAKTEMDAVRKVRARNPVAYFRRTFERLIFWECAEYRHGDSAGNRAIATASLQR